MRPNRLATVPALLWLALWGVVVFYLATAILDFGAKPSGTYAQGLQDEQELENGN